MSVYSHEEFSARSTPSGADGAGSVFARAGESTPMTGAGLRARYVSSPMTERLMEAIRRGDPAGAAQALEDGAWANDPGDGVLPPLALAARLNQAGCAEVLVLALEELAREGGHASARELEGQWRYPRAGGSEQRGKGVSALQEAARNGSVETARLLAGRGWDLEERGPEGRTALMWACERGHEAMAAELLRLGSSVEGLGEQLKAACRREKEGIARLLLEAGVDADAGAQAGEATPLMQAAAQNRAGLARMLIGFGADLEARGEHGRTALHEAARMNALECVQELLRSGADPRAKDDFGIEPLAHGREFTEEDHERAGNGEYDDPESVGSGELNEAARALEAFLQAQELEGAASGAKAASAPGARL